MCKILLASGFFSQKCTKRQFFFFTAIYVVLDIVCIILLSNAAFPRYIICIALCVAWLLLVYDTGLIKGLFTACLSQAYLLIVDAVFMACSRIFMADSALLMFNPYVYYRYVYGIKIVELMGVIPLRTWARGRFHHKTTTSVEWLLVLFFPIASVVITWMLIHALSLAPALAPTLLPCVMLLLLTDFLSVFILDRLERAQQASTESAVLRQSLKLQRENIAAMTESYARQRTQTHDFQNRLSVLRHLAEKNAAQEEFSQYLNSVLETNIPSVLYIDTGRIVIDVILSQKYAAAKNKSINFQMQVDNPSGFPLPDDELVVVLSNLLDNAFDACDKIPDPENRYVLLKMQAREHVSNLYIENRTLNKVDVSSRYMRSTKGDPLAHGYGLKNVYAILDQHKASCVTDYRDEDHVFVFSMRLEQ
jgi:hypothetical protein